MIRLALVSESVGLFYVAFFPIPLLHPFDCILILTSFLSELTKGNLTIGPVITVIFIDPTLEAPKMSLETT